MFMSSLIVMNAQFLQCIRQCIDCSLMLMNKIHNNTLLTSRHKREIKGTYTPFVSNDVSRNVCVCVCLSEGGGSSLEFIAWRPFHLAHSAMRLFICDI